MPNIIINLSDDELKVLQKFAEGNNLTPEEYGGNILKGWLQDHIRGILQEKIRKTPIEKLKTIFGEIN